MNRARPPLRPEIAALAPSGTRRLSSFAEEVEDRLLDERVLVQSGDGHRFEGHLVSIQHQEYHVLLTDVEERPSGGQFLSMVAPDVDWIVRLPADQ